MNIRKLMLFLLTFSCLLFSYAVSAKMFGATLCKEAGYHCQRVKHGQTWRSLWPNPQERNIVMRVNRMNTQLYEGIKVAVPDNLSQTDLMTLSPFPLQLEARNEKVIIVDPSNAAWGAYAGDGKLIRWGPLSAGADYCKDIEEPCRTHEGDYRIYTLGSSDCHSRKFPLPDGGAPMPYCMYFNNGQALHGEPNGLPGYNASHGCVRLYVSDAEWLRYSFVEGPNESNEFRGTKVIVNPYLTENPYEDDRGDQEDDAVDSRDNYTEYDSGY